MPKQLHDEVLIKQIVLNIKALRKSKNITLEVFFFDTGIHLARIEQSKQNISISTLSKICNYFEISLSSFFLMIEENQSLKEKLK